jgi:hypothetical protein
MSFIQLWLYGYTHPGRFIDGLAHVPAPRWGFYGALLRALFDSFLLYLPLFLLGRVPPLESYLPFIPTERYYGALVWLGPLVLVGYWLLGAGVMHLPLRLLGKPSDYDLILNISGMVALVVGSALLLWDWLWIVVGGLDQVALGISHLVIDLWAVALTAAALKRLLGVPLWLGVLLNLLVILAWLPFGMMFMRSPL